MFMHLIGYIDVDLEPVEGPQMLSLPFYFLISKFKIFQR